VTTTPQTPAPKKAVASSDEYFNSSRLKVIGLIVAATLAVGALGALGGVLFDPEPVSIEPQLQPGSDSGSLGSPGNASPRGAKAPALHGFAAGGAQPRAAHATESPSSVGSVSPGSGGVSDSPTGEPTQITGEPSPTDDGDNGTSGGQGTTISATDVDIFVPDGWQVTYQDDNNVGLADGAGSFAFAFSTTVDPSTSASDIIAQNMDVFLPQDLYTQLQTSDIVPIEPFGSVVSVAGLGYQAVWVDNQGSSTLAGEMYVGVRQDGTLLVILIEHMPAEDIDSAYEEMASVVNASFVRFAGLG
jgi:hypothetical protein